VGALWTRASRSLTSKSAATKMELSLGLSNQGYFPALTKLAQLCDVWAPAGESMKSSHRLHCAKAGPKSGPNET